MKIVANNLCKRFNREWIFKNFNFEFEPGATYAVTGPNGSGKSTLLQILWGQLPATSGTLSYQYLGQPRPSDQLYPVISIAAPYMDLIEEFTLAEMVNFHFKFKAPRDQRPVNEVIDLIEMSHARNKVIAVFSSGMRQRLKLGLAFFTVADALFLDEPTTNLDAISTAWYNTCLQKIPKETTILIASNLEREYPSTAIKIDILAYK